MHQKKLPFPSLSHRTHRVIYRRQARPQIPFPESEKAIPFHPFIVTICPIQGGDRRGLVVGPPIQPLLSPPLPCPANMVLQITSQTHRRYEILPTVAREAPWPPLVPCLLAIVRKGKEKKNTREVVF